jgi:uncharacterized protein involved in exopolysaccharide biosynthesis
METLDTEPRGWDEGPGLLQSAWRYNWIVAVAALLGALLGYGLAARQPVLYQGTSRLLFGSTSVALPGQVAQPSGDPDRYLNNQAQLIRSSEVLERAAKRSEVEGAAADSLAAQLTVEVQQDHATAVGRRHTPARARWHQKVATVERGPDRGDRQRR